MEIASVKLLLSDPYFGHFITDLNPITLVILFLTDFHLSDFIADLNPITLVKRTFTRCSILQLLYASRSVAPR